MIFGIKTEFQLFRISLFRFLVVLVHIGWFAISNMFFHLTDGSVPVLFDTCQSNVTGATQKMFVSNFGGS